NQDVIRRFTWVIASMNVHLEELRYFWAKTLGISGPQWMILMALADLDHDDGVPVNAVSKKLHVDSSFVTTQSKLLEKKGFLRRRKARRIVIALALPGMISARTLRLSRGKTASHLSRSCLRGRRFQAGWRPSRIYIRWRASDCRHDPGSPPSRQT